jgi:hypothetical protein
MTTQMNVWTFGPKVVALTVAMILLWDKILEIDAIIGDMIFMGLLITFYIE